MNKQNVRMKNNCKKKFYFRSYDFYTFLNYTNTMKPQRAQGIVLQKPTEEVNTKETKLKTELSEKRLLRQKLSVNGSLNEEQQQFVKKFGKLMVSAKGIQSIDSLLESIKGKSWTDEEWNSISSKIQNKSKHVQ